MRGKWTRTNTWLLTFLVGVGTVLISSGAHAHGDWDDRHDRHDRCGRLFSTNNDQNKLVRLDDDGDIERRKAITGLAPGDRLVGIDFRPAGLGGLNQLYGLGLGGGTLGSAQLYTIDTRTAVATPVGVRFATPPVGTLVGTSFGVDFNPTVDRIRVVSDVGQNFRLNPDTGAIAGTDTPLAYPATGDPNSTRAPAVTAVAYTNPDNEPVAPADTAANQTNTVLYDIDTNRAADAGNLGGDVLAIQVPPNAGTLNTVGRIQFDSGLVTGFDIGPGNEALVLLQKNDNSSRLFRIDLLSGRVKGRGHRVRELLTGVAIELGPQCVGDRHHYDDHD